MNGGNIMAPKFTPNNFFTLTDTVTASRTLGGIVKFHCCFVYEHWSSMKQWIVISRKQTNNYHILKTSLSVLTLNQLSVNRYSRWSLYRLYNILNILSTTMFVYFLQLIFTKEYTQAEGHSWHIKHFCCYECDKELGGQRYVAKEDHPYCLECYGKKFAKVCNECKQRIPPDAKRVTYSKLHWHAAEECFNCNKCKTNLLGQQFIFKEDSVFCSVGCARSRWFEGLHEIVQFFILNLSLSRLGLCVTSYRKYGILFTLTWKELWVHVLTIKLDIYSI